MKRFIILLLMLASNVCAQTMCLTRTDGHQTPDMEVVPFVLDKDLSRPMYVDVSTITGDCTSPACMILKDDIFILSRSNQELTLTWIKQSNSVVRMNVEHKTYTSPATGKKINFLKTASSNGYTYYLLKNGSEECVKKDRWKYYTGKFCSTFTIEAFETNPNSAMQAKYYEPDDSRVKIEQTPCGGPAQPGTGTGGEPPPPP